MTHYHKTHLFRKESFPIKFQWLDKDTDIQHTVLAYLISSAFLSLSRINEPISMLKCQLDHCSTIGCCVSVTDVSKWQITIGFLCTRKTIYPIYRRLKRCDISSKKLIYFVQFLLIKNKMRIRIKSAMLQHLTLWKCKMHLKLSYFSPDDRENLSTFLILHLEPRNHLRFLIQTV